MSSSTVPFELRGIPSYDGRHNSLTRLFSSLLRRRDDLLELRANRFQRHGEHVNSALMKHSKPFTRSDSIRCSHQARAPSLIEVLQDTESPFIDESQLYSIYERNGLSATLKSQQSCDNHRLGFNGHTGHVSIAAPRNEPGSCRPNKIQVRSPYVNSTHGICCHSSSKLDCPQELRLARIASRSDSSMEDRLCTFLITSLANIDEPQQIFKSDLHQFQTQLYELARCKPSLDWTLQFLLPFLGMAVEMPCSKEARHNRSYGFEQACQILKGFSDRQGSDAKFARRLWSSAWDYLAEAMDQPYQRSSHSVRGQEPRTYMRPTQISRSAFRAARKILLDCEISDEIVNKVLTQRAQHDFTPLCRTPYRHMRAALIDIIIQRIAKSAGTVWDSSLGLSHSQNADSYACSDDSDFLTRTVSTFPSTEPAASADTLLHSSPVTSLEKTSISSQTQATTASAKLSLSSLKRRLSNKSYFSSCPYRAPFKLSRSAVRNPDLFPCNPPSCNQDASSEVAKSLVSPVNEESGYESCQESRVSRSGLRSYFSGFLQERESEPCRTSTGLVTSGIDSIREAKIRATVLQRRIQRGVCCMARSSSQFLQSCTSHLAALDMTYRRGKTDADNLDVKAL